MKNSLNKALECCFAGIQYLLAVNLKTTKDERICKIIKDIILVILILLYTMKLGSYSNYYPFSGVLAYKIV